MAEFSARRVVVIAAAAGALVGGAVAGGVAAASDNTTSTPSASANSTSLTTAAVARANLSTTVQVGGSIGYTGSYAVAAPSGASPQQITQVEQEVAQDQQNLSADQTAATDAATTDNQAIVSDQANVTAGQSALNTDQTKQTHDCAGQRASTPTCTQEEQKVSQDQTQLAQAQQQLAAAQSTATRDQHQNQAKADSDQTKLTDDQANLAALKATATNPGATYTWLPKVGDIIKEDQPVYSLSDQPVPLLYGSIAAYRAFYEGMSDGADVGQLTQDLIALGYGAGLSQSNHYSSATAAAVERWQTALGLPATGEILLGQAIYEPGPIRVTSVTPSVGASAGGGSGATVLSATGTTPIVTVDLDVTQEYLVKPGDAVTVVLPDGTSTVGGHVETVGNVATCPGGGGNGNGNGGAGSADQSPCASSGSNSTPTVTMTITLDSTPPGAQLDQAPVNVNITTQRADNVLAVPVTALLALAGGGFGVDVVNGTTTHLVGVTTGLYSSTLVQISGTGITEGTLVEVPSSS